MRDAASPRPGRGHAHALGVEFNLLAAGLGGVNSRRALAAAEKARRLARYAKDALQEAEALNRMAQCHYVLGEPGPAKRHAETAFRYFLMCDHPRGLGASCRLLALLHNAAGRRDTALGYYRRALQLYESAGDPAGRATVLNSMAYTLEVGGDHDGALECYGQALEIAGQLGDPGIRCSLIKNRAFTYCSIGDLPAFRAETETALALARKLKHRDHEAECHANLGLYWRKSGDFAKAEKCLKRGLALFVKANNHLGRIDTLDALGLLAASRGDDESAGRHFAAALELARASGHSRRIAYAAYDYGCHRLERRDGGACALLREALTLARSSGLSDLVRAASETLKSVPPGARKIR